MLDSISTDTLQLVAVVSFAAIMGLSGLGAWAAATKKEFIPHLVWLAICAFTVNVFADREVELREDRAAAAACSAEDGELHAGACYPVGNRIDLGEIKY